MGSLPGIIIGFFMARGRPGLAEGRQQVAGKRGAFGICRCMNGHRNVHVPERLGKGGMEGRSKTPREPEGSGGLT